MKRTANARIWGILLIAIGICITGQAFHLWRFHFFLDGWWALVLFFLCAAGIFRQGLRMMNAAGALFWLLLFFVLSGGISASTFWKLFLPLLLIAEGSILLYRETHGDGVSAKKKKAELPLNGKEISCVFTSRRVVASGQIFSGVRAKAVFGSMVLDLREAVIPEDCAIYFTAVMGSAEILVPAGVRLAVIGTPVLGEIKNESLLSTHACVPTLYLNATCVLGSIKVR